MVNIENKKYYNFWNTDYGKKFLINFIPLYLPPNSTINKVYFYSNRVLVQIKENPSKYYKIAINKYGVKENETEHNNYINAQNIKPYISPITKINQDYIVVLQEFYEIWDNKFEFKTSVLSPIDKAIEKIENLEKINNTILQKLNQVINEYNELVEYTLSLSTYCPKVFPNKISYYQEDNSINFRNLISDLGKNINCEDIGYNPDTSEFKIINFL